MSVWLTLPSARPSAEVGVWLQRWTSKGYKVALWRDDGIPIDGCDLNWGSPYPGYSRSCNWLIQDVLARDPQCDWVVCAGDDTWPDPNHTADEIAAQCTEYFSIQQMRSDFVRRTNTWGVMQPCGDDWADGQGRIIERIAGSPWIGREFAQRINHGKGPWWPEYFHNWADEELMLVAQKLGCFWQRRDLTHFHDHCMRYPGGTWAPHLQHVSVDYRRMKPLFEERKKAGWPGSEPL